MKTQMLVMSVGVVLLALGIPLAMCTAVQVRQAASSGKGQGGEAGDYKITGPYAYNNLAIFLIHGKDKLGGKTFLTLQEAMERKKVIVYETRDVNELAIENTSPNEEVYVQSGDIVKGGQQDRMLGVDLIVPPRSGKIPIAAFCVEHGRWSRRGNEGAGQFSASTAIVATKDLKLAAKKANSQSEVWSKVAEAQNKLSSNLGGNVNSTQSASSFQLTLENSKVQETADTYVKALSRIVEGKNDVIGYAFAINGKVNSADVYASSALFKKLWPKLLRASAVEAIADLHDESKFEPAAPGAVNAFIADSEKGEASEKDVTARVKMVTRETPKNILFETRDRAGKEAWLHRNYIKK